MKRIFFFVDGGASLLLLYASIRNRSADLFYVLAVAGMLTVWHNLEAAQKRRLAAADPSLPDYPGGQAWPQAAFAGVLVVCALDRMRLLESWCACSAVLAGHTAGIIGLSLFAGGIAVRLAAIRTLGIEFLRPPGQNHRRIQAGLYRYLRHPAGWGLLAISGGIALGWGSAWGLLAVFVLLLPSLLYVHNFEEKASQVTVMAAGTALAGAQPGEVGA